VRWRYYYGFFAVITSALARVERANHAGVACAAHELTKSKTQVGDRSVSSSTFLAHLQLRYAYEISGGSQDRELRSLKRLRAEMEATTLLDISECECNQPR